MAIEESGAPIAVAYVEVRADMRKYEAEVRKAAARTVPVYGPGAAAGARTAAQAATGPLAAYRAALAREAAGVRREARTVFMAATERMLADWRAILASMMARMGATPMGLLPRGVLPVRNLIPAQTTFRDVPPMRPALSPGRRLPLIETTGRIIGSQLLLPGAGETAGAVREAISGTDANTRANRAKRQAREAVGDVGFGATGAASRIAAGMRARGTPEAEIAAAMARMKFKPSEWQAAGEAVKPIENLTRASKAAFASGVKAVDAVSTFGRIWGGSTITHMRRLTGYIARAAGITQISRVLELTSNVARYIGPHGVLLAAGLIAGQRAAQRYEQTMARANEAARKLSGKMTALDILAAQQEAYARARSYVVAGPGTAFWSERQRMVKRQMDYQQRPENIYAEEGQAILGEYWTKGKQGLGRLFGSLGKLGYQIAGMYDGMQEATTKGERIKKLQEKLLADQNKQLGLISASASAFGFMGMTAAEINSMVQPGGAAAAANARMGSLQWYGPTFQTTEPNARQEERQRQIEDLYFYFRYGRETSPAGFKLNKTDEVPMPIRDTIRESFQSGQNIQQILQGINEITTWIKMTPDSGVLK